MDKRREKGEFLKQVKETTALCMRCPDFGSASKCPAANTDSVAGCKSSDDLEGLWPGFQGDPQSKQNCPLDLLQHDQCLQLLAKVTAATTDNLAEGKKKSKSGDEMFTKVISLRANAKYKVADVDTPLTKDVLEHAYDMLHLAPARELEEKTAQLKIEKEEAKKSAVQAKINANKNEGTLKFAAKPPSTGKSEKREDLITNYFLVKLDSTKTLYQYQVDGLASIIPDGKLSSPKKNTIIRRFIAADPLLAQHQGSFSFSGEGKIIAWAPLHTNLSLPKGTVIVPPTLIPDYDRTSNNVPIGVFTLDVKFKRAINFQGLDNFVKGLDSNYEENGASQALDIMFGDNVARNRHGDTVQIGDNRFFPIGKQQSALELSKKHGLIALRGFSSHVSPVDNSVTLNVNTAFSAFFKKQTVAQYIKDFDNEKPMHLMGMRVRIMYDRCKVGEPNREMDTEARRTKTITGFSTLKANEIYFTDGTHKKVSVWEHFTDSYPSAKSNGETIICVNTGDTTKGNECWFLADQLEVLPGQLYRKTFDKLDSELPAKMIDFACQSPQANRDAIMQSGLRALGLDNGVPPLLSNAGITIAPEMTRIPFRQISTPRVTYKDRSADFNKEGAWSTFNQNFHSATRPIHGKVRFFTPPTPRNPQVESAYISCFKEWYGKDGIKINAKGELVDEQAERVRDFSLDPLSKHINSVGLAVLVLPEDNTDQRKRYANFRVVADQILGKPSLVLCEKRIMANIKNLVPYMTSNMMKLNTRLGNENHRVEAFSTIEGTLVLGADLIHPKQGNPEDVPTIACLVGSIDNHFATFYGSARRTAHRKEVIDAQSMFDMATERIRAWKQSNNGTLPAKILYYRDGTGQSQYDELLSTEVAAIRKAYDRIQIDSNKKQTATAQSKKPEKLKITALVVVKRHTTRFYPTSPFNNKFALKENCRPGTVVDSHITSPYYFDFYLQSHTIEKSGAENKVGSAKPTHYFVIVDEVGFEQAALQNLTNAFCYNFSHSTSAVSYASPAYLADRLCERVQVYLKRWVDPEEVDVKLSPMVRQAAMDEDWGRGGQGVGGYPWNVGFNSRMFWM